MKQFGFTRVSDCVLLEFPKVGDSRGKLTFIEGTRHVPFEIKRLFYLYDVPPTASRGGHAHWRLEQVLACAFGSLDVHLDDGTTQQVVHLSGPERGIYIPPMIWDTEINFEPGTVCVVLASDYYDESDYIRDYQVFLAAKLQSK